MNVSMIEENTSLPNIPSLISHWKMHFWKLYWNLREKNFTEVFLLLSLYEAAYGFVLEGKHPRGGNDYYFKQKRLLTNNYFQRRDF